MLIEEKKASDKENLLLLKTTRHFEKLALGSFFLLGLEISADFSEKKGLDKENLLLQLPLNRFKDANSMLLENDDGQLIFLLYCFLS